MMKSMPVEEVRRLFDYSNEAGGLVWKVSPARAVKPGSRAGTHNGEGYRTVCIKRNFFLEHRLVWAHVYGAWPSLQIDHINGVRDDNRISNLRDVSPSINQQNKRSAPKSSKSGVLGAHLRSNGTYQPKIRVDGRCVALGTFKTAQEANEAYLSAKRKHHEGYAE